MEILDREQSVVICLTMTQKRLIVNATSLKHLEAAYTSNVKSWKQLITFRLNLLTRPRLAGLYTLIGVNYVSQLARMSLNDFATTTTLTSEPFTNISLL